MSHGPASPQESAGRLSPAVQQVATVRTSISTAQTEPVREGLQTAKPATRTVPACPATAPLAGFVAHLVGPTAMCARSRVTVSPATALAGCAVALRASGLASSVLWAVGSVSPSPTASTLRTRTVLVRRPATEAARAGAWRWETPARGTINVCRATALTESAAPRSARESARHATCPQAKGHALQLSEGRTPTPAGRQPRQGHVRLSRARATQQANANAPMRRHVGQTPTAPAASASRAIADRSRRSPSAPITRACYSTTVRSSAGAATSAGSLVWGTRTTAATSLGRWATRCRSLVLAVVEPQRP